MTPDESLGSPEDKLKQLLYLVLNAASKGDRSAAIRQMRGLLKTNQPTPTDEEVATMLEERRDEKYRQ